MARYSVPGIKISEIDNTVRTESAPGNGIGAIVMKSNRGPVNQRIVTTNYSQFVDIFGEPETETDYGHFAAENYFANSTQLFAVRATMGDEQYSQIQFSYPDAAVTATNTSIDTAKFLFVNSQGENELKLLTQLSPVTDYDSLCKDGDWMVVSGGADVDGFAVKQKAYCGIFGNILNQSEDLIVFKAKNNGWEGNIKEKGMHVVYPKYVDSKGNDVELENKLLLTEAAWQTGVAPSGDIYSAYKGEQLKVSVYVPASATMNREETKITFFANSACPDISGWFETGVKYADIFKDDVFQGNFSGAWDDPETNLYGYQSALKLEIMDWDDPDLQKTYYVNKEHFEDNVHQVSAIKYTEYQNAVETYTIIRDYELDDSHPGLESIVCSAISAMYISDEPASTKFGNEDIPERTPKEAVIDILDLYGCNDISDINNCSYLKFWDVFNNCIIEKVIKDLPDDITKKLDYTEEFLFWGYVAKGDKTFTKKSVYNAENVKLIALPIQDGFEKETDDGEKYKLNSMVATPTSFILNSIDKTYADGYTLKTESIDEPGNGDIEGYNSVFGNQLIIASRGPGEYGNDIGVSIITTECEKIAALNHQNAFNWKNRYDDDDLVEADGKDLIWKKVFRINVYVKEKNQTAQGAWGYGMDALLKDPIESWFVSTDPYAKDNEGNSLYAPTVINGHSQYIYVSRSSVNQAVNAHGEYEQPNQTYSIYQLTGGKNSKKNNISEKTAALNLYKDRNRAKFDILFNCDAVDTFNGKQRFAAHQRKIAEIAAARTQDIGVVQVTSKMAKTGKQMLSESKMFAFNNGTYVAEYGGYDKYYNSSLATWVYLPKSVAGACAMAYCDTFAYPWMAPAGVSRGTINYASSQLLRLTDDEIGQLYDNNVNTTRDCGPYGTVLWGQKTALKKNSLLNRINVRRCLNFIEKNLENMMVPYLFMQNSVNTRASARNDIDSFLQRIKSADGIENYSLSVTQDRNDPTIMNVNISVIPVSAIEFIDIKITVNRNSGVGVEEV